MQFVWPVYAAFAGCWVIGHVCMRVYIWYVFVYHDRSVDEVARDMRYRLLYECDLLTRPLAVAASWSVITYYLMVWHHTWSIQGVWLGVLWLNEVSKGVLS